jgi:adenylate kinase
MDWVERPYITLDLEVSEEEVMARMLARAKEEHRPDSATEEQIRARLAVYDAHTAPVLDYFRQKDLLTVLDGTGTPEEVEAAIHAALI